MTVQEYIKRGYPYMTVVITLHNKSVAINKRIQDNMTWAYRHNWRRDFDWIRKEIEEHNVVASHYKIDLIEQITCL